MVCLRLLSLQCLDQGSERTHARLRFNIMSGYGSQAKTSLYFRLFIKVVAE